MRALAALRAAWLLGALWCVLVGKLTAQPPGDTQSESGRAAIERGHEAVTLFERGDWQGALQRFQEAEALYHSPVFVLEQALAAQPSPPGQTATPPAPVEPAPQRDESRRRLYLSGLVWTAVGGASLIAGTVVGALALHEEAGALPDACNSNSCPASQRDAIERNYDRVHTLAVSADALLISGAVVAG